MARISRESIDKIFETARIEEVVGEFVQLKRSGSGLRGLSPFTNEKTPSFYVVPAKQIFKDFSSGKGGTVVSFLMEHEHFTYPEALRYLARKYNIDIEEEETTPEQQQAETLRESLYIVSEFAQQYFENSLWNSEEGRNIGLGYFRERGFTDETIKAFQLGYSPENKHALSNEAIKKGYKREFLEASGLSIAREEELIDRFRGRVIFPIHSLSGRTLGFGARILNNAAKAAKYLNSPESDIYHKSKVLYGLSQAKSEIVKADKCLLVEGYTDVISLWQSGVRNVVSSSGTALTKDQIRLIQRLTNQITIVYDSDPAGIRASFRGIDMILEAGLNVRVLTLPEGEDPDSFARKHPAHELNSYISENEGDFIRFKTKLLADETKNDPIARAGMIRDIVRSIALIPDDITRDVYLRECSNILDIDEKTLYSELAQLRRKYLNEQSRKPVERKLEIVRPDDTHTEDAEIASFIGHEQDTLHYAQEGAIIKLLLNDGNKEISYKVETEADGEKVSEEVSEPVGVYILEELRHEEFHFENPLFQETYDQFLNAWTEEERILNGLDFARSENPEMASMAAEMLTHTEKLANWGSKGIVVMEPDSQLKDFVPEAILRFKACKLEKIIADIVDSELEKSEEETQEIMLKIKRLGELRNKINASLNRIL